MQSYIRGFEADDLFRVWRDKSLISRKAYVEMESDTSKPMQQPTVIKVPDSIKKNEQVAHIQPGALTAMLSKQRVDRVSISGRMTRHSRFGGTFQFAAPVAAATADENTTEGPARTEFKRIVSNPFTSSDSIPSAKLRRNKKNLTFTTVSIMKYFRLCFFHIRLNLKT
jgi:hypothetical protein